MATTQSADPNEQVHHPRHYNQHPSGVECIEIIEHLPANLSHAFKYIWRCGLKTANNPVRELSSAKWYVQREIERRERFDLRASLLQLGPDAPWRLPAARIVARYDDFLACCLGELLGDHLAELIGRIEKEIARIY